MFNYEYLVTFDEEAHRFVLYRRAMGSEELEIVSQSANYNIIMRDRIVHERRTYGKDKVFL